MRRLSTGWEVETAGAYTTGSLTTIHDNVSISTGYNAEISSSSPRSGNNKLRFYRNAANTAYSPTVTVNGSHTAAVTTINYTSAGDPIAVGDVIVINGAEECWVTARNTGANTLTVTRGVNGTTAAAYVGGETINCGWTGTGAYVDFHFDNSASSTLSGQSDSTAALQSKLLDFDDQSSRCWVSPYFNIATVPVGAGVLRLVSLMDSSFNPMGAIIYNGGTFAMAIAGGANRTIFTPSTSTWYRMVIQAKGSSGSGIAGGQELSVTVFEAETNTVVGGTASVDGNMTADIDRIRLGIWAPSPTLSNASHGDFDISFDDLVVNDSLGKIHNLAPPSRKIVVAVPSAEGTTTDFVATGVAAPNSHQNVDDWANTADYNTTPNAAATHEEQYAHASTTTLGISGVEAVQMWVYHRDETGEDGTSHSFGMKNSAGGFASASTALFVTVGGDAEYQQGVALGSYSANTANLPDFVAWTDSEFDNAANQFWIRHTSATANERKRIIGTRLEVSYTSPNLSQAFSPAVTLAEADDGSETALDVNDSSGITVGDHIVIGTEIMKVTAISGNTLTVLRAQRGSSAATHASSDPVTEHMWNPYRHGQRLVQGHVAG